MVLGVCRRMLADPHDAADAFQATFLILIRKAGALRNAEQLGPWLHGVAFKVAARARSDSARRRDRECRKARPEAVEDRPSLDRADLRGILDEELNRLPEKYRRPIILCYLEGQTHEEAARRLRCTAGMLRGRLDRGREKLRSRLSSRGLAPVAVLTASALAREAVAATVPNALRETTMLAAVRSLIGKAAPAAISASAQSLAHRVLRSAMLSKLAVAAMFLIPGAALLAIVPLAIIDKTAKRVGHPEPAGSPLLMQEPKGITLTGRVLDREGRAIPGARVGQGSNRQAGATPEAVTDADGRFTFTGLVAGPVILTVQATGHAPDLRILEAASGAQPIEFRLGPGRSIGGRITDLSGKPIAGASISAGPWRGQNSLVWHSATDSDGRYRWDDAPEDEVLIDLGSMGYTSKRFMSFPPGRVAWDLTMPRPRYVRGSVTDAVTGKPIERFTVLTGHGDAAGSHLDWEYPMAVPGSAGTYEAKLGAEYRSFDRYVRIEAEGYLPERSRALGESDAEWDRTFDFKLRPGEAAITGVVRLSDGSPLVGAEVVLLTSLTPIADGRFSSPLPGRMAKTGPDGRFRFPSLDIPFTVVVLHEKGFAEHTSEEFVGGSDMTIEPWGRVEGTYSVGPKPGTGERLALARSQTGRSKVLTQFNGYATVDTDGHFIFERVHQGEVSVAQQVKKGPFTSLYPLSEPLKVRPGETASVTIGGTGRPVVGRLDLPAALAEQADWTWSEILLISSRRPQRSRVGKHTADGGFRIEDVPAGAYELIVEIKKTPSEPNHGFSDRPIASVRRRIQVPEMSAGRSDEPLDVGAVAITPEK
jgi:RNA polymerase sigma factor (sigma-70 family)